MMPYPIKPSDIDASEHLWNTFGNREKEVSAGFLVRFAQQRGGWRDFTKKEIDEFSGEEFWFNHLDTDGFIKDNGNGTYSFTHRFIATCFLHSPIKEHKESI